MMTHWLSCKEGRWILYIYFCRPHNNLVWRWGYVSPLWLRDYWVVESRLLQHQKPCKTSLLLTLSISACLSSHIFGIHLTLWLRMKTTTIARLMWARIISRLWTKPPEIIQLIGLQLLPILHPMRSNFFETAKTNKI